MLENLQYRLLLRRDGTQRSHDATYSGKSKLQRLLGQDIFERIRGKVVVDFGCGYGDETIELGKNGARRAVGLDIRDDVLETAREKALALPNVSFAKPEQCAAGFADAIISLDGFEHFAHPAAALDLMYDLLAPGGEVLVSFGPPWLHPLGGHAFSVFPWSHLLLSERALCRWYNEKHGTRISRFEDVSGGLNRMTIASFERVVAAARLSTVSITCIPIRALKRLHNRYTREYTTSVVTCVLRKPALPRAMNSSLGSRSSLVQR